MRKTLSFRPDPEAAAIIRRTMRELGTRSAGEAIRKLIRRGGKTGLPLSEDPVWKRRAPPRFWLKKSLTSEEIDEELYGGKP